MANNGTKPKLCDYENYPQMLFIFVKRLRRVLISKHATKVEELKVSRTLLNEKYRATECY